MIKAIARGTYINWLKQFREKPLIRVLTGMRRVGKSTILKMFAHHYAAESTRLRQSSRRRRVCPHKIRLTLRTSVEMNRSILAVKILHK